MKSPVNGSRVARLNFDLPRATLAGEMTLADLVADSEDEEYLFRPKGSLFYLDFHLPS